MMWDNLTEIKMTKTMTNLEIYTTAAAIAESFTDDTMYLPAKLNFYIQKNRATIAALAIGIAFIYTFAFNFANTVKTQYNVGKTLSASLEFAFKKQLPSLISSNVIMFISSLVMFAFSFGELSSALLVFSVCSFLSIFTNLLIVPLFVKIAISFNGFGTKLFMLKKRDAFAEIENKEAE